MLGFECFVLCRVQFQAVSINPVAGESVEVVLGCLMWIERLQLRCFGWEMLISTHGRSSIRNSGRGWQNIIQSSSVHPCRQTVLKCLHGCYCTPAWFLRLSLCHTALPAGAVSIQQHSADPQCCVPRRRTRVQVTVLCNSSGWSRSHLVVERKCRRRVEMEEAAISCGK